MKEFNHLMLDIETMGNTPGSAILSIGAVQFDPYTGETGEEFFERVDLQSCFNHGLHADASTIEWWLQQGNGARKALVEGDKVHLGIALTLFIQFCDRNMPKGFKIWARSPRFDCGIMKDALNTCMLPMPWEFRNEMCVRTIEALRPDIIKKHKRGGVAHDPVVDCKYQITYCSEIWQSLKLL